MLTAKAEHYRVLGNVTKMMHTYSEVGAYALFCLFSFMYSFICVIIH